MSDLTPKAKATLASIYDQLGGRPPDEDKRINQRPATKAQRDSPFYSLESWWGNLLPKLDTMTKSQLTEIKGNLQKATGCNAMGGDCVYLDTFDKQVEHLDKLIAKK